jgi:hypothetical protein
MNKRFEELDDQARKHGMSINDLSYATFHKKFAELIVQECFTKLTPYIDEFGINDVEAELKEHFGIKE